MARPQILQQLTHGKLLAKPNFPQFVETFNYAVNRCENLKGDGDIYNDGLIEVDNTSPEHPVIRLDRSRLKADMTPPDADVPPQTYNEYGLSGLSSIQTRTIIDAEDLSSSMKVLQLYNFDLSDNVIDVELTGQYEGVSSTGFDFIIRKDGQVQYAKLSAVDGCSCDLSAELTSGTKIAAWTKDGTSWTNIYAPSGGGGDCSCSMSAVIGSETYQDAAYRTNTHIAQFKDCQGNTTNVYAPDSVRFQGNVGA